MCYTNLNLYKDNIDKCLSENYGQYRIDKKPNKNNDQFNYHIYQNKILVAQFKAFYNKNGTTTLSYKCLVESVYEFSKQILNTIKSECLISSDPNQTWTIVIEKEGVDALWDYLINDCNAKLKESQQLKLGIKRKYEGEFGDCVTLTYFHNGNLLAQGKPLLLFNEVKYFVLTLGGKVDISKVFGQVVDVDPKDTNQDLRKLLSPCYNKLDGEVISHLEVSHSLSKVYINTYDYSYIPFNALKAIEKQLKVFLLKKGIFVSSLKFSKIMNDEEYKKHYTVEMSSYIYDLYDYYKSNRHGLFHTEQATESRIIDKIDTAKEILNQIYTEFNKHP